MTYQQRQDALWDLAFLDTLFNNVLEMDNLLEIILQLCSWSHRVRGWNGLAPRALSLTLS